MHLNVKRQVTLATDRVLLPTNVSYIFPVTVHTEILLWIFLKLCEFKYSWHFEILSNRLEQKLICGPTGEVLNVSVRKGCS